MGRRGTNRAFPDHYIGVTRRSDDLCWVSQHDIVIVVFDDAGRVRQHYEFAMHGRSFLGRLRHWLILMNVDDQNR